MIHLQTEATPPKDTATGIGDDRTSRAGQPLTLTEFTDILNEIREQPSWRTAADKQMDYVDGNQLDSELLAKLREIGIPPAIENVMGPAVKSVTGYEAKTRTDWRVSADGVGSEGEPVADAINYKLNQAERLSGADVACGEAFRPQYAVGLGIVEVARESDPFKYPYRCLAVHRNEIWWDMKARQRNLDDARWLVRKRWTDKSQAVLKFPKSKELINHAVAGWHGEWDITMDGGATTGLATSWEQERGWSIEEAEWRDTYAKRVCLFEVWYRRWEQAVILMLPDGRVVEYDQSNAVHVIAVVAGHARPIKTVIARMYLSYWMGPHCLHNGPSPYKHRGFPYVFFWGDKEDRTGVPFGAARGWIYLQDSINSAIAKIRWGLAAQRTERTKGAVAMSDEQFRRQVARPDADIILNAAEMAKPGARFEVKRDFALNEQQYKMLQDARMAIERMAVSSAFQGKEGTARSGLQETTQVEQSVQALGEFMSNFRNARTQVGERLMSLILEDMGDKPQRVVIPASPVADEQVIELNVPRLDEATQVQYLDNDLQRIQLKVALSDVPSTPSFRAQQLGALSEAFKSMPPQFQQVSLPYLLALMDIPDKEKIIRDVRAAGQQMTPEQIEQRINEAVEDALRKSDHDLRARELDAKYSPEKMQAEIDKMVADRVKTSVEAAFAAVQGGAQLASMPTIAAVADAILERSGWRPPVPAGVDPNLPVAALPAGVAVPPVAQNTSPQLPPVPASGMEGIETSRTSDNLPA